MATNRNSDARLTKTSASNARGRHVAAQQDQQRANDEGTALTLEERAALLRNEFAQEALPKAPDRPGYHRCWLSTTHSYDTIQKRLRLGYELVRKSDVPGFEHMKAQSGDYADYVMCNEMVLAEIPDELYQVIMREFHHDQPLREEEAIRAQIQQMDETARDKAGKTLLQVEEGMEEQNLVNKRRAPVFS